MSQNRTRGIRGFVMPPAVNGPLGDEYLLLVRPDGEMKMVHTEGVGYSVSSDKPWRWSDYATADVETFTPTALIAKTITAPTADLADWIRTFGARLESNFALIREWYLG